jgi:hypothetical protein
LLDSNHLARGGIEGKIYAEEEESEPWGKHRGMMEQ